VGLNRIIINVLTDNAKVPHTRGAEPFLPVVVATQKFYQREGYEDSVFAFHHSKEIGSRTLHPIAKKTGLMPDDL
jgi:hypothetical protein